MVEKTLEELMEQVIEGDSSSLSPFYHKLLSSSLFAPERFQSQPLSDAPKYPNEYFNLLAIRAKERTVVPVFSQSELIHEWSGNHLAFRSVRLKEVIDLIPNDWWVCVNPGLEVEKEFSPWELQKLKDGAEGIAEIVEELSLDFEPQSLEVSIPQPSEFPELTKKLVELGEREETVLAVHLLCEEMLDKERLKRILIGVRISSSDQKEEDRIFKIFRDECSHVQIGSNPIRIFIFSPSKSAPAQGIFQQSSLVFERAGGRGFLSKASSLLKKVFK